MIQIDTASWKEFRIGDLFNVFNGKKYVTQHRLAGDIPLVSTSAIDQGISDHVSFPQGSGYETHSNILTVAYSGSVGATLYHPGTVFVGETVMGLSLRAEYGELSIPTGLFLASVLNRLFTRYTYNNKVKVREVQKKLFVPLPATESGDPDWAYMERMMLHQVERQESALQALGSFVALTEATVDTTSWGEFKIGDLFEVVKRTRLTSKKRIPGDIPYVGASQFNNGITQYIGNDSHLHSGGVLTVCYNGPVGTTFFQPSTFWATDDVNVLYPRKKMAPESLLFIAPIIQRLSQRFSYIDKWTIGEMRTAQIKLPVTNCGMPDWDFMETAMRILIDRQTRNLPTLDDLTSSVREPVT